ncbi:E3 ubiquitin-protein ligase Midline-1-like [Asterias rubens]|uniref:E3 ubiquitin-protein ligase Midline-1-like n=1 Tax=Asterias rubens TaxID=7604 RepID=UPI001454E851|nr:E3 ubiquitin-protein ligase Midline-1-like [Asterias rubens]
MASNITAQSVLQTSLGHLECPICKDRFKQPKLLKCCHTFCLECLHQLIQNNPTTTLSCPVCRQNTSLKKNGTDGLKTNSLALSLLEDIEKQETQLDEQNRKQLPDKELVFKCSEHTDNDLNVYCNNCTKLICTTCIASSHRSHSLMEVNAVSANYKKQATKLIESIAQGIEVFSVAIQETDISRKILDSMFAATKEKISKKADEEKEKLIQEAEQIYEDRVKTIETARDTNSMEMDKAKHEKDEVIKMMDQGSFEIVQQKEKLFDDLREYKQVKPTKLPVGLTFMDFKQSKKPMGELVLKEEQQLEAIASALARTYSKIHQRVKAITKTIKWTLTSEMGVYLNLDKWSMNLTPRDVAVYSNGDIVTVSNTDGCLVTIQSAESNPQSTVIPEELQIQGLTEPNMVTVNKNDELIVLDDDGTVKIFSRDYLLLREFTPESIPSRIAVDDDNLIAMIALGYYQKREIFLYNSDGSLKRTLPVEGLGVYLTIFKERLIYTNEKDMKLVSVDFYGKVIFSVDINQSAGLPRGLPRSVCCDRDGRIYVAVRRGLHCSSSGDIDQYSQDGKYIGTIIKDCMDPHCITFTPAGDLVVAAGTSVQVYHRG